MKNIFLIILTFFLVFSSDAQVAKLEGPRIGFTMVEAGLLANILKKDVGPFDDENTESWEGTSLGKYGAIMSQYGWQWESRFADGSNITGIVEWIALVGGMEKGLFLPSVSSMVGIRTNSGIEFAAGPNLSLGGISMVIGAGYNFKFGGLNLPVNIAYVPSMDKKYEVDPVYDWEPYEYDDNNNLIGGGEQILVNPGYSVVHPTGARVSVMVGFNMSK